MTNKEAIINLLALKTAQIAQIAIDVDLETFDLAVKALAERDDLIERAYGHVVGQGKKGVIRPDDLQG